MSNDKGTWFGWDVSKVGPVSDNSIYNIAKSFAERVGKVKSKQNLKLKKSKSEHLLIYKLPGTGR